MRLALLCVPPHNDDFNHRFCGQTVKGKQKDLNPVMAIPGEIGTIEQAAKSKAAAMVCFPSLPHLFYRNLCVANNCLSVVVSLRTFVSGRIVISGRGAVP
jgi:hypothetical protein